MNSTYQIRLTALQENLTKDNDRSRYKRELSRLQMDIAAALKRCINIHGKCPELKALELYVRMEIRVQDV